MSHRDWIIYECNPIHEDIVGNEAPRWCCYPFLHLGLWRQERFRDVWHWVKSTWSILVETLFFCWWDAIFSFPNGTRIPFILFPINMATSAKSSIFRPTRDIVYIIWRFIFFGIFSPVFRFFLDSVLRRRGQQGRKEGRKEGIVFNQQHYMWEYVLTPWFGIESLRSCFCLDPTLSAHMQEYWAYFKTLSWPKRDIEV